jgi:5-methylcytosine-specific restriction endonuclease McrA
MKKPKKEWRYEPYIKSALRRIWRWSPERRECLKGKYCTLCKKPQGKMYADHISPVVDPIRGFVDWNTYIDRLFNGQLQRICGKCHNKKTNEERKLRRLYAKATDSLPRY